MGWLQLCSTKELILKNTLLNGQCFNWKHAGQSSFIGVLNNFVVKLRETDDGMVEYHCVSGDKKALKAILTNYFQLNVNMSDLYKEWGDSWPKMKIIGSCIKGLRIVRQNKVECLLSFICSSNNNISRITQMLDKLRGTFGSPIMDLFMFPTLDQLCEVEETQLREMGFGYRAKYIVGTVQKLQKLGGEEWLEDLRLLDQSNESLEKVRAALIQLDGVGPKVADCVALFCLDRTSVIPVDTHVWQIACRDFNRDLVNAKSLTPKVYSQVGTCFRDKFGSHAGWAHSVLFAAELPAFQNMLPIELQQEMKEFANIEKQRKVELKRKR